MIDYQYHYSTNYNHPEQDKKKKSDSLYINKNVNGWTVTFSVNEEGKLSVEAWKTLGSIAAVATAGNTNEANLNINLETTENRVPKFKTIESSSRFTADFIEIDDRLNRTAEGFKESQYYRREFAASSIVTTDEFLSQIVPAFEDLLQDTKLNGFVSKISDQAAEVQRPYNKEYRQEK
jgi:hypothetical protein